MVTLLVVISLVLIKGWHLFYVSNDVQCLVLINMKVLNKIKGISSPCSVAVLFVLHVMYVIDLNLKYNSYLCSELNASQHNGKSKYGRTYVCWMIRKKITFAKYSTHSATYFKCCKIKRSPKRSKELTHCIAKKCFNMQFLTLWGAIRNILVKMKGQMLSIEIW